MQQAKASSPARLDRAQFIKVTLVGGFSLALTGCDDSSADGEESGTAVYLTFDDGPGAATPALLEALQGAKATFFMLGRHVDQHPEIARMVKADGHAIGNHSYSHVDFDISSDERIASEIDAGGAAILRATGITPHLFRPPYLSGNAHKDQIAIDKGYSVYRGFNTHDYTSNNPGNLAGSVLKHLQADMVLMFHDSDPTGSADRSTTVQAIRILILEMRKLGYGPRRL